MNKIIKLIGFVLIILSVFVFGLKGQSTEMGIAVIASSIFLAFANLDKFAKFKGAGFEAELRAVVDDANASIEQLRAVAIPLAIVNLQFLVRNNRWNDGTMIMTQGNTVFSDKYNLFDDICNLIDSVNLVDERLDKLRKEYIIISAWDMVKEIISDLNGNYKKILGDSSFDSKPNFNDLFEYVSQIEVSTEVVQKIDSLKDFIKKYSL